MSDEINDIFKDAEDQTNKLEKQTSNKGSRDSRLLNLKTPIGVTRHIYFRMFPDATSGKAKLHLPYNDYSFKSLKTGKTVYAGIGASVLDKDAVDYVKSRQGEVWDISRDAGIQMYPTERRLVNIYVIKDTHVEDNDDTFKVLKYGAKPVDKERARSGSPMMKAFHKIHDDPDTDIETKNLFSLGADGVTFRMTIIGADIPDIEVTCYDKGKTVQGFKGLNKEKQLEAYKETAVDLLEVVGEPMEDAVVEKLIKTHLLLESSGEPNIKDETDSSDYFGDTDDDTISMESQSVTTSESTQQPDSGDEELDSLLKGVNLD